MQHREGCCHADGFTLKLCMLRGLVGEELEDLADLGVVIWLLGTPFTEECSRKWERDREKRGKKTWCYFLHSLFSATHALLWRHFINLFEDNITYIK